MSDYANPRFVPPQQTSADGGAADQDLAPRDRADSRDSLAASLNRAPRSQSLLQLRDALDKRAGVLSQLALQRALDRRNRPAREALAPSRPNATGLPDRLKGGIENLSGLAMDDVRVHYNSAKPAAVQAHAYAQGTDIHLAPGQEKHLPHEAWHVVQQKQGRVKPTLQLKGVAINDDTGLEREADLMGAQARHAAPPELASKRRAATAQVSDAAPLGDGSHQVTAAQDGRPAGSVKLHDRGSGTIEITDLGVPAAQRGSGVGHRLIESAVQAGRRLGGRKVSLDADDKGSGRLLSWYQKMGFSRSGVNERGKPRLEAPIGKVEGAVTQRSVAVASPKTSRSQISGLIMKIKGANASTWAAMQITIADETFTLQQIKTKVDNKEGIKDLDDLKSKLEKLAPPKSTNSTSAEDTKTARDTEPIKTPAADITAERAFQANIQTGVDGLFDMEYLPKAGQLNVTVKFKPTDTSESSLKSLELAAAHWSGKFRFKNGKNEYVVVKINAQPVDKMEHAHYEFKPVGEETNPSVSAQGRSFKARLVDKDKDKDQKSIFHEFGHTLGLGEEYNVKDFKNKSLHHYNFASAAHQKEIDAIEASEENEKSKAQPPQSEAPADQSEWDVKSNNPQSVKSSAAEPIMGSTGNKVEARHYTMILKEFRALHKEFLAKHDKEAKEDTWTIE